MAATAAALAVLASLSAVALRAAATQIAREHDISVTYVDPGPVGYLGPVLFAGFVFMVGSRILDGAWTSRLALPFYAWLLAFTAANVVNRCSPGWCETIGFPFTWREWSDALGGDDSFRHVMNALGAVLDLLTFVAVASLLTRLRMPRRAA